MLEVSTALPNLWIAENLHLREYQQKILDRAKTEHLLVVIPTGLGKTLIGAKLMEFMIETTHRQQKAIFLAPTRPLIDQHFTSLQSYFNLDLISIYNITGKDAPKRRTDFLTADEPALIVMTPQTLNNDLQKQRYDLKNVCLIIFDEAHRAQGNYAYCPIADHFITENPAGRILALTASPGSTQEKINILLGNLHIPSGHIEYRDRQHKEVKQYTHEITTIPEPVAMTDLMAQIYETLENMKTETLMQYGRLYLDLDPNAPSDPDQYYLSTIIKQMKFLTSQIHHKESAPAQNPKTLRILLSMNARINKIYHLLEYVESQGLENVRLALEKMDKKIQKGTASHADTFLFRDFRIQQIYTNLSIYAERDPAIMRHPKLLKVQALVKEKFALDPEARILIFTKYRDTVRTIVKFLKTTVSTAKPSKFVGQSAKSKKDTGMTQKKQLEMVARFKEGSINVLVATNVAEEGLDIAECNMVIMYDTLASEIRMIQRAGRTGRSSAGEIRVLFTQGTADERKWYIARARKKRMKKECNASPIVESESVSHKNVDNHKIAEKHEESKQTRLVLPASPPISSMDAVQILLSDALDPTYMSLLPKGRSYLHLPAQKIPILLIENDHKTGIDFYSMEVFINSSSRALFLQEIIGKQKLVENYIIFIDGSAMIRTEMPHWVKIFQKIEQTLEINFQFFLNSQSAMKKLSKILKK